MLDKSKIIMPSDEEDAAIKRGIAADSDAYELKDDDFVQMRPASEVHPKLVEQYRKPCGKQKSAKKIPTTVRFPLKY